MLDKEKYRDYVKYIRERWNSIQRTSIILGVSTNTIEKILKWWAITELSKLKICSSYDDWVASRIK